MVWAITWQTPVPTTGYANQDTFLMKCRVTRNTAYPTLTRISSAGPMSITVNLTNMKVASASASWTCGSPILSGAASGNLTVNTQVASFTVSIPSLPNNGYYIELSFYVYSDYSNWGTATTVNGTAKASASVPQINYDDAPTSFEVQYTGTNGSATGTEPIGAATRSVAWTQNFAVAPGSTYPMRSPGSTITDPMTAISTYKIKIKALWSGGSTAYSNEITMGPV